MSKIKETPQKISQLDELRDQLTETRLKILANLETSLKKEHIDSLEATQKLATILLTTEERALEYAKAMGTPKLWEPRFEN